MTLPNSGLAVGQAAARTGRGRGAVQLKDARSGRQTNRLLITTLHARTAAGYPRTTRLSKCLMLLTAVAAARVLVEDCENKHWLPSGGVSR
jgi:hypothetical protein